MIAGADSIDDMSLLRHGAMGRLFTGARAPSTLGTFLRTFNFGHVRQLDAVASRSLINLCAQAPLLPSADQLAYVDVDDTVKPTFGYAKQGAGRGYSGVKGLNVLLGIISTASSRPVIAAVRLRKGPTNSAKGAHRLVADTEHREGLWCDRGAGAAGRLGALLLRRDRRGASPQGLLLDHCPAPSPCPQGDRGHRGGRLGADQVHQRHLG